MVLGRPYVSQLLGISGRETSKTFEPFCADQLDCLQLCHAFEIDAYSDMLTARLWLDNMTTTSFTITPSVTLIRSRAYE
jgi:hypothetical protein